MEAVVSPALNFGGLLRQFRTEARLTQEELAEAAGIETPRLVRPPRGHAPTVVLDKGGAVRSSGRAVEQSLGVQQSP
jgi:hypothetical protein